MTVSWICDHQAIIDDDDDDDDYNDDGELHHQDVLQSK